MTEKTAFDLVDGRGGWLRMVGFTEQFSTPGWSSQHPFFLFTGQVSDPEKDFALVHPETDQPQGQEDHRHLDHRCKGRTEDRENILSGM